MACYIEGKIEHDLKGLICHRIDVLGKIKIEDFYQRRTHNVFIQKIRDYFSNQVERSAGIDNLEAIIYTFSWKNIPEELNKYPNWEGIKILFELRNVLAHGREVSARRITAPWLEKGCRDDFKGGYKKTEDYLCRKSLANNRRVLKDHSVDHFFTNKVADHFYFIADGFIKYYVKIIKEEKKKFNISDIC